MKHLVLYTHYPRARDVRVARALVGADVALDLVMPVVSPPICEHDIAPRLAELPSNFDAIIQPPEDQLPLMTLEEALQLARADQEWVEMLAMWQVDDVYRLHSREFPHFWLISAQVVPQGIPPGGGFIVDKYSRRVLCRRYVDVKSCIETGRPVMALR